METLGRERACGRRIQETIWQRAQGSCGRRMEEAAAKGLSRIAPGHICPDICPCGSPIEEEAARRQWRRAELQAGAPGASSRVASLEVLLVAVSSIERAS